MLRMVISISIGCSYLYMAEIFPSVFRGICVGMVCIIGRTGGVLAPLVADTLIAHDIVP